MRWDGDPKGRGHIRCNVCGEPVRDHAMRPCPSMGMEIIYVGTAKGDLSRNAQAKRRQRERQQKGTSRKKG